MPITCTARTQTCVHDRGLRALLMSVAFAHIGTSPETPLDARSCSMDQQVRPAILKGVLAAAPGVTAAAVWLWTELGNEDYQPIRRPP